MESEGVMPMRPRDVVPVPRYWVMVIEVFVLPSMRACHWMWRVTLSEPVICVQNMGPRLGATWARMPLRLSSHEGALLVSEVGIGETGRKGIYEEKRDALRYRSTSLAMGLFHAP